MGSYNPFLKSLSPQMTGVDNEATAKAVKPDIGHQTKIQKKPEGSGSAKMSVGVERLRSIKLYASHLPAKRKSSPSSTFLAAQQRQKAAGVLFNYG